MNHQTLTPQQQKAIKRIFLEYREKANIILDEHRKQVKHILADLEKQKMEELKKRMG